MDIRVHRYVGDNTILKGETVYTVTCKFCFNPRTNKPTIVLGTADRFLGRDKIDNHLHLSSHKRMKENKKGQQPKISSFFGAPSDSKENSKQKVTSQQKESTCKSQRKQKKKKYYKCHGFDFPVLCHVVR